jgi:hypothetical protein
MQINLLCDHFASPSNGVKFLPQLFEQLVHVELHVTFNLLVGLRGGDEYYWRLLHHQIAHEWCQFSAAWNCL